MLKSHLWRPPTCVCIGSRVFIDVPVRPLGLEKVPATSIEQPGAPALPSRYSDPAGCIYTAGKLGYVLAPKMSSGGGGGLVRRAAHPAGPQPPHYFLIANIDTARLLAGLQLGSDNIGT